MHNRANCRHGSAGQWCSWPSSAETGTTAALAGAPAARGPAPVLGGGDEQLERSPGDRPRRTRRGRPPPRRPALAPRAGASALRRPRQPVEEGGLQPTAVARRRTPPRPRGPWRNAFTAGIPLTPKRDAAAPGSRRRRASQARARPSRAAVRLLEHRLEQLAGAAPLGPEVDDDRQLARALDDVLFEGRVGDVHGGHGSRLVGWPGE